MEDKSRGLYSLTNKNLARENVAFPEAFTGELGENVFRFKEKFLQAIQDSQVRDKDKVDVLRKHLTGEAKKLIGSHHTSLDDALEVLLGYFGKPLKIWEKTMAKFRRRMLGDSKQIWGRYGEQKHVMALAEVIEFIREATEMAESYEDLKGEIYHSSTTKLVLESLPWEYRRGFNDLGAGLSSSAKDRLKDIKDFLEMKNDSAVDAVEQAKSENSSSRPSYDTRFTRGHDDEYLDHNTLTSACQFCNGSNCKVEYGGLGCLEIYNLDTRKQRCDWLMGHKLCIKCGLDFKSKHKCGWSGRLYTKCSNSNCLLAAATCDNKAHKNKLSKELFYW